MLSTGPAGTMCPVRRPFSSSRAILIPIEAGLPRLHILRDAIRLTMNISIGLFVRLIVPPGIGAVVAFLANGMLDLLPL
jgi:hypothetical protein